MFGQRGRTLLVAQQIATRISHSTVFASFIRSISANRDRPRRLRRHTKRAIIGAEQVVTIVVQVAVVVVKMQVVQVVIGWIGVLKLVLGRRMDHGRMHGLQVDLELVAFSYIERVQTPIGQLELFGAEMKHELVGFRVYVK